jgi:hypothetical protein
MRIPCTALFLASETARSSSSNRSTHPASFSSGLSPGAMEVASEARWRGESASGLRAQSRHWSNCVVSCRRSAIPQTFVASWLLDAAKRHLQRAVKDEAVWQGQTRHVPDRADHHRADEPSGALILSTAARAGVISQSDAWLMHTTVIVGHSVDHAAGRLGVTYETAKKRRQRAGHGWASWWAPEHLEPSPSTTGEVA